VLGAVGGMADGMLALTGGVMVGFIWLCAHGI